MSKHIHIIGAGLAGLSAALQLTLAGQKVTMYEAAPFAGGRCRSFHDRDLDCLIDNGNHLVLSGNVAVHDYLFLTDALDTLGGPNAPVFPFVDMKTGDRWVAQMSKGRFPAWLFDKNRRVAGTKPSDYLSALSVLTAGDRDIVAKKLNTRSTLYRRFWEPLTIGALNTQPEIASARLLGNIFAQSFSAGGAACKPLIPKVGLSETFINPCLDLLQKRGVAIHYGKRLRSVTLAGLAVQALDFNGDVISVNAGDWVILALPAWVTQGLLPEITTPTDFRSIISAHYRVDLPANMAGFTGLVGSVAEWVFVRNGVASVTVSCAERYAEHAVRNLAVHIWGELAKLYDLDPQKIPPHKIFKEKYATFAATPEQNRRRPTACTKWKNLALAGEWTATGLPSTIEGAIRSGIKASQVVLRWD